MNHLKRKRLFSWSKHIKNSAGFTLVEMVVTVVIIGILSAVGFVMYTGEINLSRDATRITNTKALYQGSKNLVAQSNKIPFPDRGVALQASGVHIGYQGYVSARQSTEMGFDDKNFQDPQTKTPYTYRLNKNRDKSQFLAYLESDKYQKATVFGGNTFIDSAYAAEGNIYPYVVGDPLGIVIFSGSKMPIQEAKVGVNADIQDTLSGSISGFTGNIVNIKETNTELGIVTSELRNEGIQILSGVIAPDIIHQLQKEELNIQNINESKKIHKVLDTSPDKSIGCAVIDGGSIECWGKGIYENGQQQGPYASVPIFNEEQVTVEIGEYSNGRPSRICSLGISGKTTCWGADVLGRYNRTKAKNLGIEDPRWNNMESISAGSVLCGIQKNTKTVVCTDRYNINNTNRFEMISVGINRTNPYFCGVTHTGSLYCQGSSTTLQTSKYGKITSLSTGSNEYACLTNNQGNVHCWNMNNNTELGVSPVLSNAKNVKIFDTFGSRLICVEKISGGVLCWDYSSNKTKPFLPDGNIKDYGVAEAGICTTDGKGSLCEEYLNKDSIWYPRKSFTEITTESIADKRILNSEIWTKNRTGFINPFDLNSQISGTEIKNITSERRCVQKIENGIFACAQGDIPNSNVITQSPSVPVSSTNFNGSWICGMDSGSKGHCFNQTQTKMKVNWPALNNTSVKDILGGDGFGCAVTTQGVTICYNHNNNTYQGPTNTSMISTNGRTICAVHSNDTKMSCWSGTLNFPTVTTIDMTDGIEKLYTGVVSGNAGEELKCVVTKTQKVYCNGRIDEHLTVNTGFTEITELAGKNNLMIGVRYVCGWSGNTMANIKCRGNYQK